MPRPRAIVAVSAHWYIRGTKVTAMERPQTIHDFGGFPKELFEVQYPAPGDPALASHLVGLLTPAVVDMDQEWGLDHGTWSVLVHIYPEADIPVVQLSIDRTRPPSAHYDLAQRLSPLRDDGVLILGSGNLVHNLHSYAWGDHTGTPYPWALEFETKAKQLSPPMSMGRSSHTKASAPLPCSRCRRRTTTCHFSTPSRFAAAMKTSPIQLRDSMAVQSPCSPCG